MKMFDFFKEYKLENDLIYINIIQITEISEFLKKIIDDNLSIICEGKTGRDINIIKKRIKELFKNKPIIWQMATVAEFFIHLIINQMDYKQECLFLNLEENQLKKGFDGLYTKNNEIWIMESKSGSISTKNITHKKKIQEAILDLNLKFSGKLRNDPWRNAYNHAAVIQNRNNSLLQEIEKLSDNFHNKKQYSICDFNIIPTATIFFNNFYLPFEKDKIFLEVKILIEKFKLKKAHIICNVYLKKVLIYLKNI